MRWLSFALAVTVATAGPPVRLTAGPPTWVHRSALYEVFIRDFSPSGDLRGVTRGLDRIQATGANVIWLMPVYPVGVKNRKDPLGSPYSVRDYRAINPDFGTPADLKALVTAAHAKGLKLILDWVPNHTSWDNVWVTQHPEFYVRNEKGEMTVPRDDQGKLTDWTDVAQLDYKNPGLRREMIATMRWWLTTYSLDGFRVDVAGFVPEDFWREAIPELRKVVPRPILLLAEWGDVKLNRAGFDLTYGWDEYAALKAVWKGNAADSFVRVAAAIQQSLPPGGMRLRFVTNHDETAWDQPPVMLFHGGAGARAAFIAMALLPGSPLLYNGQEVESPQKLGLFTRDSIVWNQPDRVRARDFYQRVLRLALGDSAFLKGALQPIETSAPVEIIAYQRGDALVLVNSREAWVRFVVKGMHLDGLTDLLYHQPHRGDSVSLPSYGALVLARRVIRRGP